MDFSEPQRALKSLQRRRPALPEDAIALSESILAAWSSNNPDEYFNGVSSLMESKVDRWEVLSVGLFCGTDLLEKQVARDKTQSEQGIYVEGPRVPSTIDEQSETKLRLSQEQSIQLATLLHKICLTHLEHDEPRVRTLVAKAVGVHAALFAASKDDESSGPLRDQCIFLHEQVVASISKHIAEGRVEEAAIKKEENAPEPANNEQTPKPDLFPKNSNTIANALDDTTGWRALETNWQCLACFIGPLGPLYFDLFPLDRSSLLKDCKFSSIEHVNRHVRAAGMLVLEHWIRAAPSTNGDDGGVGQQFEELEGTVLAVLKDGLADNWSQVRMAASVLCRVYLTHNNGPKSPKVFPILLPRMCLNRFYLAQGVKLYSHETWRMAFGEEGLALVTKYTAPICRYYVKMCDADNHAVREAACQAVAELAVKLGNTNTTTTNPEDIQDQREALQPYVPMLLQALLMCFHDESWPVRDEACLACGTFCKAFPQECAGELDILWERWTEQLTDQIWSVRQGAAVAVGEAMDAYGEDFLAKILGFIKEKLPCAKEQPAMSMEEYKKLQNDVASHTDSQLYSCGSLAPKLRKGGAGRIGCSSCAVNRAKAPWEATDGCVYLIRELCIKCCDPNSQLQLNDQQLLPLLTELADVCRVQHFPQSDDLRATLWRQLPLMAQAIGKQRFKRLYLDVFLDLLMSNLERRTASQLSKHAAGQCAEELAQLVGNSIFRGRMDDYQQSTFDRAMQERQRMPRGPVDSGFSPFGPPGLLDAVGTTSPSTMAMGFA